MPFDNSAPFTECATLFCASDTRAAAMRELEHFFRMAGIPCPKGGEYYPTNSNKIGASGVKFPHSSIIFLERYGVTLRISNRAYADKHKLPDHPFVLQPLTRYEGHHFVCQLYPGIEVGAAQDEYDQHIIDEDITPGRSTVSQNHVIDEIFNEDGLSHNETANYNCGFLKFGTTDFPQGFPVVLDPKQTRFGLFEFQVSKFCDACCGAGMNDAARQQIIDTIRQSAYFRDGGLEDRFYLHHKIIELHGNESNPVQAFLDSFQGALAPAHPLKNYKIPESTDFPVQLYHRLSQQYANVQRDYFAPAVSVVQEAWKSDAMPNAAKMSRMWQQLEEMKKNGAEVNGEVRHILVDGWNNTERMRKIYCEPGNIFETASKNYEANIAAYRGNQR